MAKRRKGFSDAFERDWNWYINNRHIFTFSGALPKEIEYSENGKTAKECFHKFDSEGKLYPCSEPQLLQEVFNCKGAINMQIKEWGTDLAKGYLFNIKEIIEEYNLLDWMITAITNTSIKEFKKLEDSQKNIWR